MAKSSAGRPADDDMDFDTADDIIEDLRAVVRDAEELLRATDDQAVEKVSEARSRVEETLESARARLEDAAGEKGARIRTAARSTQAYVKDNPWTALIIAVGAGYLIGRVGRAVRRRS